MKLTTRCGTAAVDGCNEALLAKAAEAKLLRTTRLRADTTVVPADVAYPTDSGLLAKAVRRIAATGRRVQAAGGATRTRVRDRSRAAGARAREIGAKLRLRAAQGRDEAQATVRRITGELAELAERAAADAEKLLANARRALRRARPRPPNARLRAAPDPAAGRRRGRLHRAVDDLTELLAATRRIAAQTRQRLSGITPDGATRRVSLHDGDARPIAKGRLGGRWSSATRPRSSTTTTASCSTTPSNAATPPTHHNSPPRSAGSSAAPGRRPRTVTADRGYGEARVENDLHELGVRTVVIPRKGRPGKARQAHEHRRARVPPHRQVAHRQRSPDQHPQTAVRLGSHPPRRPRRSPDLDRTRRPRPQPGQDRRPHRLIDRRAADQHQSEPASPHVQTGTHRVLQVEVAIPDWHGCANRSRCTWWG